MRSLYCGCKDLEIVRARRLLAIDFRAKSISTGATGIRRPLDKVLHIMANTFRMVLRNAQRGNSIGGKVS